MDRVTIPEAADILGVTRDAVRKRIKRASIRYETGDDGETYVYVDTSATNSDTSGQDAMLALVESLRDQVEYLRQEVTVWQDEARRKDHLLAAALERIPAIEAPPDTPSHESSRDERESPVVDEEPKSSSTGSGAKEEPQGGISGERTPRSRWWWRGWFG